MKEWRNAGTALVVLLAAMTMHDRLWRWCLAALILCSFLSTVSPAVAAGEHPRHSSEPFLTPAFEIPGATNGFRIEVFGLERTRRDPAKVGVIAWNDTSATSYLTEGRVYHGRIRASLGRFGKVDVRFKRSGKRWFRSPCGPRFLQTGAYEGVVEFEGEEGFTQAIAPELVAEPLYHDPLDCAGVEEGFGGEPGVRLQVLSRYGTTVIVQNVPGGQVQYEAHAENRIGRLEIGRTVVALGAPQGFHWSSNLKRATVVPPAPFAGTATYRALGGRITHWEGNLKVDFPGFLGYPLTPGPSLTEFIHGDCHVLVPSDEPHPPIGCY